MTKRTTVTLNKGALSNFSVSDLHSFCEKHNVKLISCNKVGGLLVQNYQVVLEGNSSDITTVVFKYKG